MSKSMRSSNRSGGKDTPARSSANFSSLYLIHGEERLLMEEAHRRFIDALLTPDTQAFNYTPFNGRENRAAEILSAAETLPVFSEKRLVWIWDAEQFDANEGERFLGYLERPSPTTVLVFSAAKPDFRKKLFTALRSTGEIISCAPLPEREIPRWIGERARGMGLSLSREALLYLKEALGNNLHGIIKELEKLDLVHREKSEITLQEVQEMVVGSRGHSVFDWLRAVGEKNLPLSLQRLGELLADGEHPLLLLNLVVRQLRQMAVAKEHLSRGGGSGALPRMLGFPPSVLQPFLQQTQKWTETQLKEGMVLAMEVDVQLKGGALPGPRLMEGMVFDLCEGGRRHTPRVLLQKRE
ncbi:MAG TPA: DNA polymerase III subunit delta [Nitrospiria bacterium]|nr:DNA polymerase III subunit delta [Nitrospiria bacterium]